MFRFLFLFFVIVPIIEITVLIQAGQWLGTWPTVAIVILTAWLGAKYVRQQGIMTLKSVQSKAAHGEIPSEEIVTGLLLLVAGVLLVTPGFVTDFLGLALLIPKIRLILIKSVQQVVINNVAHSVHMNNGQTFDSKEDISSPENNVTRVSRQQGQTLEGEFERKE